MVHDVQIYMVLFLIVVLVVAAVGFWRRDLKLLLKGQRLKALRLPGGIHIYLSPERRRGKSDRQ